MVGDVRHMAYADDYNAFHAENADDAQRRIVRQPARCDEGQAPVVRAVGERTCEVVKSATSGWRALVRRARLLGYHLEQPRDRRYVRLRRSVGNVLRRRSIVQAAAAGRRLRSARVRVDRPRPDARVPERSRSGIFHRPGRFAAARRVYAEGRRGVRSGSSSTRTRPRAGRSRS